MDRNEAKFPGDPESEFEGIFASLEATYTCFSCAKTLNSDSVIWTDIPGRSYHWSSRPAKPVCHECYSTL